MKSAIVYSDGSSGQNGYGGWCAIIALPEVAIAISGSERVATNNHMELLAAIKGIEELGLEPHQIHLVSDSAYLLNTISNRWYDRWFNDESRGFGHKRPNLDLWKRMAELADLHTILCVKVKGHSGNLFNSWCDKLAMTSRKNQTPFVKQEIDQTMTIKDVMITQNEIANGLRPS